MTVMTELDRDWASWLMLQFPDARRAMGHDEWLVLCPFHTDRNPSCAVNTRKGVFICRSCGKAGGLDKLREKVGGGLPSISVTTTALRSRLNEYLEPKETLPFLDEAWLAQFSPDNGWWTETRGLLPSTVERYRLCIDEIERQAIIPVYWQGSLRGVIRRAMLPGRHRLKYKFPRHLPRKELLFGYDQALKCAITRNGFGANPLIVTEGQIDTLAAQETGVRSVALGGNMLLVPQRNWLMRLDPTAVIVGLDNDEAGRGQEARGTEGPTGVHRIAAMCRRTPVYVVDWSPYKDPADIRDLDERTEYVLDAKPYRVWRKAQANG